MKLVIAESQYRKDDTGNHAAYKTVLNERAIPVNPRENHTASFNDSLQHFVLTLIDGDEWSTSAPYGWLTDALPRESVSAFIGTGSALGRRMHKVKRGET